MTLKEANSFLMIVSESEVIKNSDLGLVALANANSLNKFIDRSNILGVKPQKFIETRVCGSRGNSLLSSS